MKPPSFKSYFAFSVYVAQLGLAAWVFFIPNIYDMATINYPMAGFTCGILLQDSYKGIRFWRAVINNKELP